jgi:hypothetical protein
MVVASAAVCFRVTEPLPATIYAGAHGRSKGSGSSYHDVPSMPVCSRRSVKSRTPWSSLTGRRESFGGQGIGLALFDRRGWLG